MKTVGSLPSRWPTANLGFTFPTIMLTFLVALLCYQGDRLAYILGITPAKIASFWVPTPLLVAVLLLAPRKIWPVLVAAGLGAMALADLRNGVTVGSEIWITLGNIFDVLVATVGINWALKGVPQLTSLKALARYLLVAVILAPFVSALIGAIGSLPGGYWLQWRLWFFADALAFLTVTPAILTWVHEGRTWARKPLNYLELVALMTALAFFGYFTFIGTGQEIQPARLYSLVPLLLWAALRLRLKGVSTSMIVIAFLAIGGAAHGRGPFAQQGTLHSVLSLQLFLFFAAIPFMFLAVLVEEEKRAEETLSESEERFRLVANSAPVMIWMSAQDKLCTYFNQPWLNFTGRRLEAELGNGWAEGVHPEDRQECVDAYVQAVDRREPFTIEYRLRRHDGEYRWVLDSGIPRFGSDGSYAGYIGSAVDVTDRKRAQEALSNLSGRLIEAQDQERHHIARELHDDISQKLMLLSLDLQQFADGLPDPPSEACDRIMHRTAGILSDLHALSHRLHSSKLELLGLVPTVRSFCRELAEQRNVNIDFKHRDVPDILPPGVSLCLFRVLQEGLSNAVKHSGALQFTVRLESVADQLKLTIHDRGVGFDPGMAMYRGGLGLISMRERVSLLKGSISIISKPHNGTEIQVRVPVGARTNGGRQSTSV